jgi:hypothetical protein
MYVKEEKCRFLVKKTAGKRPLGGLMRKLEDNIKMDIRVRRNGSGLNYLAYDADQWLF